MRGVVGRILDACATKGVFEHAREQAYEHVRYIKDSTHLGPQAHEHVASIGESPTIGQDLAGRRRRRRAGRRSPGTKEE